MPTTCPDKNSCGLFTFTFNIYSMHSELCNCVLSQLTASLLRPNWHPHCTNLKNIWVDEISRMIWGLPFGGPLDRLGGPSAKKEPTIISFLFSEHFANIVFYRYLIFNFLSKYLFL